MMVTDVHGRGYNAYRISLGEVLAGNQLSAVLDIYSGTAYVFFSSIQAVRNKICCRHNLGPSMLAQCQQPAFVTCNDIACAASLSQSQNEIIFWVRRTLHCWQVSLHNCQVAQAVH